MRPQIDLRLPGRVRSLLQDERKWHDEMLDQAKRRRLYGFIRDLYRVLLELLRVVHLRRLCDSNADIDPNDHIDTDDYTDADVPTFLSIDRQPAVAGACAVYYRCGHS